MSTTIPTEGKKSTTIIHPGGKTETTTKRSITGGGS